MNVRCSRREFVAGLGALAVAAAVPSSPAHALDPLDEKAARVPRMKSPFRLGIISDEISQDFGHACEVIARGFGLGWIEIRELWNKNILALDEKEVSEARRILDSYNLRVTDICSPLFKVDWPGAPRSRFSPPRDQFGAAWTFEQQDEVLERSIALAKALNTSRVRCFDFWRLDDQAPWRAVMNEKLLDGASKAGKTGITLLLENEFACNTATGAEAAALLKAVRTPWLMLNWDPGNAAARGENAYPDGYRLIPKDRIGHCHCKDVVMGPQAEPLWTAVGRGSIDWVGQFRALKSDRFRGPVMLETHWRGAGAPEESTRQSWAGMKDVLAKAGAL